MKKGSKIRGFIFFLFMAWCLNGYAEKVFSLTEKLEPATFPNDFKEMFVDTSAILTRWQLNGDLFSSKEVVSINKVTDAAYWYKFTLQNNSKSNSWILEFHDPHVSEVEIYRGDSLLFPLTGYSQLFKTKNYAHKNFTYGLLIERGETITYYARLKSRFHSDFGFVLKNHRNFTEYALSEYFFLGMFYGVLAILAIYNLFLFFSIKENTYLYYVSYIMCAAIHTFSEDGLGFQFVWPNVPALNHFISLFSFPMLLITFLLYSNSFIEFGTRLPLMRKWVVISTIVYSIGFIYFNFIGEWSSIMFFLYVIPYLITYYSAIKIYQNGFKQARFFVIGFSIVLVSFVVFFLRVFVGLTGSVLTVYIFNFGFILEAIMLSYALGDKIKITKEISEEAQRKVIEELEKNEKLKDKVNRELETKVKERTIALEGKTNELTEANEELGALRDKLYEMNSALDKANWRLQREVKDVMRSKILSEAVGYEDFIKIFPDNLTCMKHLEEIKWSKGFKCKKCGHTNFSKMPKPFVRKCSSCKHPESVTANTLFHAVKFPMNKAFYIAYITCENQKKITIDELSDVLELRRNTAWMFKKKVEARIEELIKKGKYKMGESWEKLIV